MKHNSPEHRAFFTYNLDVLSKRESHKHISSICMLDIAKIKKHIEDVEMYASCNDLNLEDELAALKKAAANIQAAMESEVKRILKPYPDIK